MPHSMTVASLLLLAGCTPDYALHAVDPAGQAPAGLPTGTPGSTSGEAPAEVFSSVSTAADGGSAVEVEETTSGDIRREHFVLGGGASTPVADFLFVVDNSASMDHIVGQVRAAFAALGERSGEAFPAETRIAVMSTLPGDPDDLRKAHPYVRHQGRNRRDPGFLRLVDASTVADFLKVAPEGQRSRFTTGGCESGWFSPEEKNGSGVPCLVAATQIAMDNVGVEAGLTAFAQLLEGRGDTPLFRPGAAANVVFVSDTQDPGLGPSVPGLEDLVTLRPDYARLVELVDAANTVSSFRVHAIAPEGYCGERWDHLGDVYQQAARASGGRTLDVCTATDYRGFVADIAREGAVVQRPVVALSRALSADTKATVEVDGVAVGWAPSADGRAIILDQGLSDKASSVTVTYPVKRAGEAKPAAKPATRAVPVKQPGR